MVDLAAQVRRGLVDPSPAVAFFVVSHPVEDPSSFSDRDSVANVEDAEDVEDAVDEVALVADVGVGYEDVGSDSVEEPELVVSYTATQTENTKNIIYKLHWFITTLYHREYCREYAIKRNTASLRFNLYDCFFIFFFLYVSECITINT